MSFIFCPFSFPSWRGQEGRWWRAAVYCCVDGCQVKPQQTLLPKHIVSSCPSNYAENNDHSVFKYHTVVKLLRLQGTPVHHLVQTSWSRSVSCIAEAYVLLGFWICPRMETPRSLGNLSQCSTTLLEEKWNTTPFSCV